MNTEQCITSRRSIRKYKAEPVSSELLQEVVELSRFAPSWKNTQTPRYHIILQEDLKTVIAEECVCGFQFNTKTLLTAPAIVVLSYVTKRCGYERDGSFSTPKEDRWEMFDAGIAAQTFCLAAKEKGLGTCIMGIFDEEKISDLLHLPEDQKIGAVIALGYADCDPEAPSRKSVEDLLTIYS